MTFNYLLINFLPYFCMLSLLTIGLIFSERVGIINLGINGIAVFGATIYMVFANLIAPTSTSVAPSYWQLVLFLLSAIGGLLFSLLHGFVCIKLKANQVISGIALNILSPAITILILFIFGDANKLPGYVNEFALGSAASYEITNIISLKVFVTLIAIILAFIVLSFTRWGLRLKSIGENPQAADVAGINVNKNKWFATMIAGVLAGLAGAVFMTIPTNTGNSFKGDIEGLGYLAIAIMIVGRWRVLWSTLVVITFSILFGLVRSFNQIFPEEKTSIKEIVRMIPYLLTLVVLIFLSQPMMRLYKKIIPSSKQTNDDFHWNGPKAVGEPYDKSKR